MKEGRKKQSRQMNVGKETDLSSIVWADSSLFAIKSNTKFN